MRQKGFSLIELMVALVLGLLIVEAVVSLFLSSSRSYGQDQKVAALQDEMRFAMAQLTQDIEMAGYWARLLDPGVVNPNPTDGAPTIGTDCGPSTAVRWFYTDRAPLATADNVTSSTAAASFSCIASGDIKAGSDILAIKRVAGRNMTGSTLATNQVYLQADATSGTLFQHPATGLGTVLANTWPYQPVIYFIRPYSVTAADGIPTLCRKYLESGPLTAPTTSTECIASGVEDMQVEFGLDADGDGKANSFVSAPSSAQLATATVVRLSLLMRSSTPDNGYTNAKTYTLGNKAAFTPNDNFYRRVVSSTVLLRNPAALRILNP